MTYQFTIIVPVYNNQDSIKTTILSIVNQDLDVNEYEIIVEIRPTIMNKNSIKKNSSEF